MNYCIKLVSTYSALVFSTWILSACQSTGEDLQIGPARYYAEKGEYQKSIEHFNKIIASDGRAACMALTELGEIYTKGVGVDKDYTKARGLFETVLNKPTCIRNDRRYAGALLAELYQYGNGVEQNIDKAIAIYMDVGSAIRVARIYWDGELISRDREKAVELLRGSNFPNNLMLARIDLYIGDINSLNMSSEQLFSIPEDDNFETEYQLGVDYLKIDSSRANFWLQKAANGGNNKAKYLIGYLSGSQHLPYSKWRAWEKVIEASNEGYAPAQSLIANEYMLCSSEDYNPYAANNVKTDSLEDWLDNPFIRSARTHEDICATQTKMEHYQNAFVLARKAALQGDISGQYIYASIHQYNKDQLSAVHWYQKSAEQGHALSMFALGMHYADSNTPNFDYNKAKSWFEEAADKNNTAAMRGLFRLHIEYLDPIDKETAKRWLKKAIPFGDSTSALLLADLERTEKHTKEALRLYQKAAELGQSIGTLRLAQWYQFGGESIEKDSIKAANYYTQLVENNQLIGGNNILHYLNLAFYGEPSVRNVQQGLPIYKSIYKQASEQKNNNEMRITLARIALNPPKGMTVTKEMIRDLLRKVERSDDAKSKHMVADMYAKDYTIASIHTVISMYKELVAVNDFVAAYHLAEIFTEGKEGEVHVDYDKAINWYQIAAEKNHFKSQARLGVIYRNRGDHSNAAKWLEAAASTEIKPGEKQWLSQVQYYLADYLITGKWITKDVATGIFHLTKAAKNEHSGAQFKLGMLYYEGKVTKQDLSLAEHWLSKLEYNGFYKVGDVLLRIAVMQNDNSK